MPRKKVAIDYGQGECGYRFCDKPDKKFPLKKEDQKFCCPNHRVKEWNLVHPRIKQDGSVSVNHGLPVAPDMNFKTEVFMQPFSPDRVVVKKRQFHFTRIELENERGSILRKTLELLMRCEPSTLEINLHSGSTRGSSDVAELREQGFHAECYPDKSVSGKKINRFRLTAEGKQKAIMFFRSTRNNL